MTYLLVIAAVVTMSGAVCTILVWTRESADNETGRPRWAEAVLIGAQVALIVLLLFVAAAMTQLV